MCTGGGASSSHRITSWQREGITNCSVQVSVVTVLYLLQYQDSQERKQAKHKFHFNAM